MIVDEAKIKIKAGDGGDGAVSFRRERFVPRGGPDGGDGGDGGDVILLADRHISDLSQFSRQKDFIAENGQNGKTKRMKGKDGKDLILNIPLGTQVFKFDQLLIDLTKDGQNFIITKGGQGGWGNWHFATSVKQAPEWSKKGLPGESEVLRLELKMIADIGIIGLPNAGKSTLLSVLSNARPKIASYPFTTLEPNLGAIKTKNKTIIVADIPGLIEGASKGRGLGIKFLKHIERTKVLIHLLDATGLDISKDYRAVRKELNYFSPKLARKKEIIVLNKIDAVDKNLLAKIKKDLKKKITFQVSAATGENIDKLTKMLLKSE